MIALPSPLGFGFFAFGAFEKLKKIFQKPKSLRTMIIAYGGERSTGQVSLKGRPGKRAGVQF